MAALPVAEGQEKSAISLAKDSDSEEKNQLEKKLESILENMEGVGKVQVMLMTDEKKVGKALWSLEEYRLQEFLFLPREEKIR